MRCRMHDDLDCEVCEINKADNVVEFNKKFEFPKYCVCKEIFVTDKKDCNGCKKGEKI